LAFCTNHPRTTMRVHHNLAAAFAHYLTKLKNKGGKEQHDNNHGGPITVASKKPDLAHNNWLLLLHILKLAPSLRNARR
jgi:hypothetical protein